MTGIELQTLELVDQYRDLERCDPPQPLQRKPTFFDSLVTANSQNRVNSEAASSRTAYSIRSFNIFRRWPTRSSQTLKAPVELESSLSSLFQAQDKFISLVIGEQREQTTVLVLAARWYITFLQSRLSIAWCQLLQPVLADINPLTEFPSNKDMATAFQLLATTISQFKRQNLALAEIADELYNQQLLIYTDQKRTFANLLVFAAFGWITFLYTPKHDLKPNYLEIINPAELSKEASPRRVGRRYKSKTFDNYEQTLENKDQPLFIFLRKFGKIIPEMDRAFLPGQYTPPALSPGNDIWLDINLICFHMLHRVAKIKIEWVDCLSLHLEFNTHTRALKLFRFPSICLLMHRREGEGESPLSQIFWDSPSKGKAITPKTDEASEFFKEILLSYRLIFGQNRSSFRDFNNLSKKWQGELEYQRDPLLAILCGRNYRIKDASEIYDEIDAVDPFDYYCPVADFPFLGRRLSELQRYVKGHKPTTLMGLWHDSSNLALWWTIWVVVIIGGIGFIFAILQVISPKVLLATNTDEAGYKSVLQILQVIYAHEQLLQQPGVA